MEYKQLSTIINKKFQKFPILPIFIYTIHHHDVRREENYSET